MKPRRLPSPPYNPGVGELVRAKRQWSRPISLEDTKRGFAGWHESGYLPHRDQPGLVQFVTFTLADAFPATLHSKRDGLLRMEAARQRRLQLEAYLDQGRGECHLCRPQIARLVEASLLFRHGTHYELRAWVIMPNHVHVLYQQREVPMSILLDAWKGYTAKQANRILGRTGQFWQEDYWDTFMRDGEHERRSRRYVENNPVKAGLVNERADWPWSSARFRDKYERLCLP